MNWKIFSILILTLIFFQSCKSDESFIQYKYNGNTLTRLDKGQKTYLYDGDYTLKAIDSLKPVAVINWHFDNYFFWFIQFNNDSTITLINGGGGMLEDKVKLGSKLVYSDFSILDNRGNQDEYDNLYQFSNDLELEEERNTKFGSNVKRELKVSSRTTSPNPVQL